MQQLAATLVPLNFATIASLYTQFPILSSITFLSLLPKVAFQNMLKGIISPLAFSESLHPTLVAHLLFSTSPSCW